MAPVIEIGSARLHQHPQPLPPPQPVRRPSGFYSVSPVEARRRAFRELTEAAAKAYDAASTHRAAGDESGAALLVAAAGQALNQAAEIGEELARL